MSIAEALTSVRAAISAAEQIQTSTEVTASDKAAILCVLAYASDLLSGAKLADSEVIARIQTGAATPRDPADIFRAAPGEDDEVLVAWSGKLTKDEVIHALRGGMAYERKILHEQLRKRDETIAKLGGAR